MFSSANHPVITRVAQLRTLLIPFMVLLVLSFSFVLAYKPAHAANTSYYVSSSGGNDNNAGTSPDVPWQTLAKVAATTFQPGDTIYLKAGDSWNEQLSLQGSGTATSPITLAAYGSGDKPKISWGSGGTLKLINLSGWTIKGLEIVDTASTPFDPNNNNTNESPLYIEFNGDGPYSNIVIDGNDIHGNSTNVQDYGLQIKANYPNVDRTTVVAHDITISNNSVHDVGWCGVCMAGLVLNGPGGGNITTNHGGYQNVNFVHNTVYNTGDQGVLIQAVNNGSLNNNLVHDTGLYTGSTPVIWSPSPLWVLGCDHVDMEYNEVYNGLDANSGYDSSGIDVDWDNYYVNVQYNYLHDNKGAGIEVLSSDHTTVLNNRFSGNKGGTSNASSQILLSDFAAGALHGITNATISNNVIIENTPGIPAFQTSGTSGYTWSGNAFTNNYLQAVSSEWAYRIQSNGPMATVNNNTFYSQSGTKFTGTLYGSSVYSLPDWQSSTGFDTQSQTVQGAPWLASADFSTNQGQNQWRYQYWSNGSYTDLPSYDLTANRWGGLSGDSAVQIGADLEHPGQNDDVARTWVAPSSGTVSVSGNAHKDDTSCGNGVRIRIIKNNDIDHPLFDQSIAYDNSSGVSTNVSNISVNSGDSLHFQLSKVGDNNYCDTTGWDPQVSLIS